MESFKLKQALILAGGLGERLKPLTLETPKPLISVNGKPFITYLIDRLISQDITDILILTGFKSDQFHFLKNKYSKKIKIRILITPVAYQTGSRMLSAIKFIDHHFILLYGDNYWPFNVDALVNSYKFNNKVGQIVVYRNSDRYSVSNVSMSEAGLVSEYDKSRKSPNLNYVDIGFGIFSKNVLSILNFSKNDSFEKQVYEKLVLKEELSGFITNQRYYSLTNLDRLGSLELMLSQRKYLFLDRDGVINKKAEKGKYITKWSQWEWNVGAIRFLKLCKKKDIRVIIISNQAAIGRKMASQPQIDKLHATMKKELDIMKANCIEQIYICPHHWVDNCECRKPKSGLLIRAQKDLHLDLSKYIFIGDSQSDLLAAQAEGMQALIIDPKKNIYIQLYKLVSH
ncbi:HAD-IIIA family hydrolase [Candidatus Methylopumilus planktonicus]|uniref:HAD-IIIA family hydrolase n=1 Tax=Candidatus Methylopumilus planktonicus TaxID=1581557 RepID=UPI003BEEF16E